MKNAPLHLVSETIQPGEVLSLALPLPELFSCAPFYMPIEVAHGKEKGPVLLITAAIHGNELNGAEIINRLLKEPLLQKLAGTIIAVPVVNVYGLINRSRNLPGGKPLNSSFPGSDKGTHAARFADLFIQELFAKADICLDLQTGAQNYAHLPQLFIDLDNPISHKLALAFGCPVISEGKFREGSLGYYAQKQEKPFLVYEAGEAMRFDEHAISTGLQGALQLLEELGMVPGKKEAKTPTIQSVFAKGNRWVRSLTSGVSYAKCSLGDHVKKGDVLSVMKDLFGSKEITKVHALEEGIIVGINNLPFVYEGESLFQLATFSKTSQAAAALEEWKEGMAEE